MIEDNLIEHVHEKQNFKDSQNHFKFHPVFFIILFILFINFLKG